MFEVGLREDWVADRPSGGAVALNGNKALIVV